LVVDGHAAAPDQAKTVFCQVPADCGAAEATCVAWTCRFGAERTSVAVGHRVAVIAASVSTTRVDVRRGAALLVSLLRSDLERSGFYDVLAPSAYPAGWERDGASLAEVRRQGWLAAGATRLIQVVVSDRAGGPRMVMRTIDLERWGPDAVTMLSGELPTATQGEAREFATSWVNALIGKDTGLAGGLGNRLVGTSETAPGIKEIVTVRDDGSEWVQVTTTGSLNLHASWGPNGKPGWMSYVSGNTDWVYDHKPFSTRPGLNSAGSWSPDGRFLALAVSDRGDSQLILLDGTTGEEYARLTDTQTLATSPTWSSDGSTLAFVSDKAGLPQIFTLHLATGKIEQLTRDGYNANPEWSPAGAVIAFQRQVSQGFAVMRLDLATGQVKRLSQGKGSSENPTFSPDGRYIAYTVTIGRSSRLWIMTADGEQARALGGEAAKRSFQSPSWQPAARNP